MGAAAAQTNGNAAASDPMAEVEAEARRVAAESGKAAPAFVAAKTAKKPEEAEKNEEKLGGDDDDDDLM